MGNLRNNDFYRNSSFILASKRICQCIGWSIGLSVSRVENYCHFSSLPHLTSK